MHLFKKSLSILFSKHVKEKYIIIIIKIRKKRQTSVSKTGDCLLKNYEFKPERIHNIPLLIFSHKRTIFAEEFQNL